jgi:hypothetical protein
MDLQKIADILGFHLSVIENYYEEWQHQEKENEEDHYEVTFVDYLCNIFAECAFLTEAAENGSNAMACLEAYDEAYTTVESILDA